MGGLILRKGTTAEHVVLKFTFVALPSVSSGTKYTCSWFLVLSIAERPDFDGGLILRKGATAEHVVSQVFCFICLDTFPFVILNYSFNCFLSVLNYLACYWGVQGLEIAICIEKLIGAKQICTLSCNICYFAVPSWDWFWTLCNYLFS